MGRSRVDLGESWEELGEAGPGEIGKDKLREECGIAGEEQLGTGGKQGSDSQGGVVRSCGKELW